MLKFYIKTTEALHRLRTDNDGVVSFEYIIVACLIIGVVGAAFAKTGPLNTEVVNGISRMPSALTTAIACYPRVALRCLYASPHSTTHQLLSKSGCDVWSERNLKSS